MLRTSVTNAWNATVPASLIPGAPSKPEISILSASVSAMRWNV